RLADLALPRLADAAEGRGDQGVGVVAALRAACSRTYGSARPGHRRNRYPVLDVTEQTGRTPAYAAQELVHHRLGTHFRPRRHRLREKAGFEPACSVGGAGAAGCRWACPLAPPLWRGRGVCPPAPPP